MAQESETIRHETGGDIARVRPDRGGFRGTGSLRKAARRAIWVVLAALLPLFPALATAAPKPDNPGLGVGIASLTLLVMLVFVAAMWQHLVRQIRRSQRPRWEDWG